MKNPMHSAKSVLIILLFAAAVFSLISSVFVFFIENGEGGKLLALALLVCSIIIIVSSLKYIIHTVFVFKKSLIENLNNDKFLFEHLRYQRDEWDMFLKKTSIKESKKQRINSIVFLIIGALFILFLSIQDKENVFWGVGSVVFLMVISGALYANHLRNKVKMSVVTLTVPEVKITSLGILFGQSYAISYNNRDGYLYECSKQEYLGMNCICLVIKQPTRHIEVSQYHYVLIPQKREDETDEIIDRLNYYLIERKVNSITTTTYINGRVVDEDVL